MADNVVAIFERLWALKDKPEVAEGRILTAQAGIASVVMAGSAQPTRAIYNRRDTIVPGDDCVLIRTKRTAPWIVAVVLGKPLTGTSFATPGTVQPQLSPPVGLRVKDRFVEWQAPPQYPVVFEVQTSPDQSELNATTHLVTRGSYFLLDTLDATYVRVRSVGMDFRRSAWSDWLAYSPPDTMQVVTLSAAFARSSPVEIGEILEGQTVERIVLHVTQAYNGSNLYLKVGDSSNNERLMKAAENLPDTVAIYETLPMHTYPADTPINLYFNGVGTTTGAGVVYVDVRLK